MLVGMADLHLRHMGNEKSVSTVLCKIKDPARYVNKLGTDIQINPKQSKRMQHQASFRLRWQVIDEEIEK